MLINDNKQVMTADTRIVWRGMFHLGATCSSHLEPGKPEYIYTDTQHTSQPAKV